MPKRLLLVMIIVLLLGVLFGCSSEKHWGSFTSETVLSSDGQYRAEHSAIEHDDNDVSVIQVNVYDHHTNELLDSFIPARAMDFWGICWEEGTHRIWIQSADIGIYCYELQDGHWVLNEDIECPDTIISKWEAE